jgi:hypothetical protein
MAHNAKGFDGHFILAYCMESGVRPDSVIYQGSKIMYMRVKHGLNIKFIDSLNFLPMALKALPKAMGLGEDVRKGDFPHFFNVMGNFNYIGPMPDPSFYGVDFMRCKDREAFMKWYDDNRDAVFDFQKEMLAYTRADVIILREACMKFRDLIREATHIPADRVTGAPEHYIDIFAHATLASGAMQIIRYMMMAETHKVTLIDGRVVTAELKRGVWYDPATSEVYDSASILKTQFVKSQIPQIPTRGYMKNTNHSLKAIVWLEWVSLKELGGGRKIQHARNGGEFNVPGTRFSTDGRYGNTVYEFNGCFYHGHHCMTNRSAKDPRTALTMNELYARTILRAEEIRAAGYTLVTMWECEWDRKVAGSQELREFAARLYLPRPLRIRDALCGGRTCAVKLYRECTGREAIRYADVTSLYPYTNLHMRVPTCHPEILTDPDAFDYSLNAYFGIIHAKVLPPTDLYIPVLPYRTGDKLLFPLCRVCCEKGDPAAEECRCSDADRAITGTWCSEELKKALTLGYRIVKIYEVYHYPETTQYDPHTGEGGLFKDYVHTFMKLKQEASGYPKHCTTDASRNEFIEMYRERQGITLDKDKICYNPGLRLVAKLFLNSAWGKFCERANRPRVVFVKTPLELARMQNDPTKEISDFHIVNDNIIAVEVKSADEFVEESGYTNEVIGALTTSYGRLQLLDILLKLNAEDVLYFDTDSVVFVANRDDPHYGPLEMGDLLGELTDELGDPDTYITAFASSGPKSYAYKTNGGEAVLKIKGITLNYRNSRVINFDSVKKVIRGEIDAITTPRATQIRRQKLTGTVYNMPHSKTYSKVFTKRRVIEGSFDTVPYGFRGPPTV